jgi:Zn finger protein HypA/HybF involved in hydrogenase expression
MSNFNSDFKNVLKNLENNVKDKEALESAKVEIFNLYNLFFDEITEIEQTMNKKILAIAESQLHVEEEIKNMNKSIKNIEKDIYMEDDMEDEECDVEIKCPYCNASFNAQMNDLTASEIICPECNNSIKLDWGEDDEYGCGDNGCDCCPHDCHYDEDDDM